MTVNQANVYIIDYKRSVKLFTQRNSIKYITVKVV